MQDANRSFDDLDALALAAYERDRTIGSVTVALLGEAEPARLRVETFLAGRGDPGLTSNYKFDGRPVPRRAAELLVAAYGFSPTA